MICEKCGKNFTEDWRKEKHKECRFCSRACANSRTFSEEARNKKSISLKKNEQKVCLTCGKKVDKRNKSGFCIKCIPKKAKECKIEIKKISLRERYINRWLDEGSDFVKGMPRLWIREFILQRQNGLCNICNMPQVWNKNHLVFVLDHINGDNGDNSSSNLRMICPNCDSQTPTFKSRNKGKGRKYDREYRKEYYHRNKKI